MNQLFKLWSRYLRAFLLLAPGGPGCSSYDGVNTGDDAFHVEFGPTGFGLARWEMAAVARKRFRDLFEASITTLKSVEKLVSDMRNLQVTESLSSTVAASIDTLRQAIKSEHNGSDISIAQRVVHARKGLALSLEALHHKQLVGLSFFSWEYTGAVYLPIGLPVIVPCAVAVWRSFIRPAFK